MSFAIIWYGFETVGTIAFAVSGAMTGIIKHMDIFGITVLSLATAIGGGIIRDVLMGMTPPTALQSAWLAGLPILVALLVFLVIKARYSKYLLSGVGRRLYFIADTIGLASFTVTGTTMGIKYFEQFPLLPITLGLITAIGGGIIRDVLAQQIPSVLREDIYALPSIIGGLVNCLLAKGAYDIFAACAAFGTVFVIRLAAVYFHWSLPKI